MTIFYITRLGANVDAANTVQIKSFLAAIKSRHLLDGSCVGVRLTRFSSLNVLIILRFYLLSLGKFLLSKSQVLYTRDSLFALVASKFTNRYVIIEHHSINSLSYFKYFGDNVVHCFISTAIKDYFTKDGIELDKFLILPSASASFTSADLIAFDQHNLVQKIKSFKNDRRLIVHTGSLYKGLDVGIRKVAGFLPDNYCLVHLGGTRSEVETLNNYFKHNNISNALCFSNVEHNLCRKIQSQADLLLLLISDKWVNFQFTSPLKIFEYRSLGIKVLATKSPSIVELLGENYPGYISSVESLMEMEFLETLIKIENMNEFEYLSSVSGFLKDDFTWADRAKRLDDFILDRLL